MQFIANRLVEVRTVLSTYAFWGIVISITLPPLPIPIFSSTPSDL